MKLKKLTLEDFKGVKNADYAFDSDVIKVSGKNGCGKTTIATAFFWLLINKDYSLKDNPNIRPNDMEESLPKVTVTVDVNGKEITLSKAQAMKKSKPDENGVCKVSLTNSYEINSIPKTERDFKAYLLDEMGIDTDLIAELSHPDVFTKNIGDKKQRDHVRETLFKMCNTYSDLDIAKMGADTQDIAKLLENYKMDEIKAMYSATKKKANEQIDAIPMQIVGLEKAKVDFDGSALELHKNELVEQLKVVEDKISSASNKAEIDKLESESFSLMFDINECKRKSNEQLFKNRMVREDEIGDAKMKLRDVEYDLSHSIAEKERLEKEIPTLENQLEQERKNFAEQKAVEFDSSIFEYDDSKEFCPCCGQKFPVSKIADMKKTFDESLEKAKKDFENRKKELLYAIQLRGKKIKEEIAEKRTRLSQIVIDDTEVEELKNKISLMEQELSLLPESVDMDSIPEYVVLTERKANIDSKVLELKNSTVDTFELNFAKNNLETEIKEVEAKISLIANNSVIDEKIAEMKKLILEYEQGKADAEKILYQVDLVNKKKNELCEDEINKNFTMVKFKLFDYQKNGSYIECAIPMSLDNKPMYESTNTALEVLMKLDIANGLQRFYGMNLPIILDNAECLDDRNLKAIKSDSQMVLLCVTNDDLKVEVM